MKSVVCFIGTAALAVSFATPAAAKASKEENIGIGVGGVVGAVAGGPVGFIVGSAAGAFVGDRFHQRGEKIDALDASLAVAEIEKQELTAALARRDQQLASLDTQIDALRRPAAQAEALLASGIEMNLLFATDTAAVDTDVAARVTELASRLAGIPNVVIEVNGHADSRGTPDYNLGLSMRRAEGVRQLLLDGGFPSERITVSSHGASRFDPTETTADSLAAQRRVELRVTTTDTPTHGQLAGL